MSGRTKESAPVSRVCMQNGRCIYVHSTSADKPVVPAEMREKWRRLTDLVAKLLCQPHALVTNLENKLLKVIVHNETQDTTFDQYDSFPLGIGVYCETTMSSKGINHVPDALADEEWKNNPSVDFGLISYIGVPLRWPDGQVFGTICSLDCVPHMQPSESQELLNLFRSIIETDLELLVEKDTLSKTIASSKASLREMHHRIKNHLNMIMSMMQLECMVEFNDSSDFTKLYEDMEKRIMAVAELHTMLAYGSEAPMELHEYLAKLIDRLMGSLGDRQVEVRTELGQVEVDSAMHLYMGIILNELISNSLRHAFGDHPRPVIEVSLHQAEQGFSLTYKDNGPGLPEGKDLAKSGSLGMQLVLDLTSQLNGTLEISNREGARFSFLFPEQTTANAR